MAMRNSIPDDDRARCGFVLVIAQVAWSWWLVVIGVALLV